MILLLVATLTAWADPEIAVEAGWFGGGYRFAQATGDADTSPLYPGRLAFGWGEAAVPVQGFGFRGEGWFSERLGISGEIRAGAYAESFQTTPGGAPTPAPAEQSLLHSAIALRVRRSLERGEISLQPSAGVGLWIGDVVLHGSSGADRAPASRIAWAMGPMLVGGAEVAWGPRVFGGAEVGLGTIGLLTPAVLSTELSVGFKVWSGLYASAGWTWSGRLFTLTVDDAGVGEVSDQLSGALLRVGYKI